MTLSARCGGALLLVGAMLTPTLSTGQQKSEEAVLTNPYMPLGVGATWEYQSGGKKVVVKVAAHETLDGMTCARLETEVGGGKITEHITVKPDGIYRVRANNESIEPPLLLLKLPSGDQKSASEETWFVDSKVKNFALKGKLTASEAKLTIGKEQYETIRVKSSELAIAGQLVEMETWYAKDKGMVKQHFKLASAELDVVLELQSFTPGR